MSKTETTHPIKAALDAAAETLPAFNDMYEGTAEQAAAAVIAAFLDALPMPSNGPGWTCIVVADHVRRIAGDHANVG